jgi:hypothetical protein
MFSTSTLVRSTYCTTVHPQNYFDVILLPLLPLFPIYYPNPNTLLILHNTTNLLPPPLPLVPRGAALTLQLRPSVLYVAAYGLYCPSLRPYVPHLRKAPTYSVHRALHTAHQLAPTSLDETSAPRPSFVIPRHDQPGAERSACFYRASVPIRARRPRVVALPTPGSASAAIQ